MIDNYNNQLLPTDNAIKHNDMLYTICAQNDIDSFLTLDSNILFDTAIINWVDNYGNNCVMIGLENGTKDDILLNILSSVALNLRQRNSYQRSMLLKACFKGRLNIVKKIIEQYQHFDWNLNEVDINNYNPYLAACVSDNIELIEYLEKIPSISQSMITFDKKDAFLVATQYDCLNVVKYLFKKELNSYNIIDFLLKLREAKEISKTHFYQNRTKKVYTFLNQQYKLLHEINVIENMFPISK